MFIDGWNLHRGCERAFGHGPVHPLLLGRVLAGSRNLHSVEYHIGVPDSRVDPDAAGERTRQLRFMADTGVIVEPRKLRYRWEWKIDKWSLPHPAKSPGETRSVEATAFNQGREKGVDVALAVGAFRTAQRPDVDVVIIVSADNDLNLIAELVGELPANGARVENAVVNPHGKKIINHAFAWSHQITQSVFDAVRDSNDHKRKMDRGDRTESIRSVQDADPREQLA